MKRTKKIVALLLAAVLLVTGSVAATIAYLTASTNVVNNTFTVGHVAIELDEAPVDLYGEVVDGARRDDNEYKLIPGHTYTKDPIVYVEKGSEKCYVFIKVANGISAVEAAEVDGYEKIATQILNNDWLPLTGETGVYYYNTVVDAMNAKVSLPVFEEFKIDGEAVLTNANGDFIYEDSTITIDAYAVQADGMTSAADAWAKAEGEWEN